MTPRVRRARTSDIEALPPIERAAARLFPEGRIDDPDETQSPEELAACITAGLAWVSEEAGRPTGFVIARELDGALHVAELAVDPAFGRRGAGTALMHRAMAEAGVRGLPRVTLTTFEDLAWNAPFYRRLGFRVLGGAELTTTLAALLERERENGLIRRVAMAWNTAGEADVDPIEPVPKVCKIARRQSPDG